MIEIGKNYRTRCGWQARVHATDMASNFYPVLATILCPDRGWVTVRLTAEGYFGSSADPHDYDLIEVRPRVKITLWVNLYRDERSKSGYCIAAHDTKEVAVKSRGDKCLMTIPVTIEGEEGEGL